MKTKIGSDEVTTKPPESPREMKAGKNFTISDRAKEVADLIPGGDTHSKSRAEAVARLQAFMKIRPVAGINIKELIEEGRD